MKTKEQSIALKTMAIKARVYNKIRTALYKKHFEDLKDEEKEEVLKMIFDMNHEAHWELNSYKSKRKAKAAIQKLRDQKINLVDSK